MIPFGGSFCVKGLTSPKVPATVVLMQFRTDRHSYVEGTAISVALPCTPAFGQWKRNPEVGLS